MKWHESCIYMELPREYSVEELAKFHGHLSHFIVLSYRIGRFAIKYFDNKPFPLFATVYCSVQPPESCLIDGIQIWSGCIDGKRNIELSISPCIPVMLRHADCGAIFLKQGSYLSRWAEFDGVNKELALENFAEAMYSIPHEELVCVEEV